MASVEPHETDGESPSAAEIAHAAVAHVAADTVAAFAPAHRLGLYAALAGFAVLLASAVVMVQQRAARAAVVPEDTGLAAAAAVIAKDVGPRDGLVFHPGWAAAQRWRFAEAWQARGLDVNAALILGHPIDLWDADGLARLWVVSTHGWASRLDLPAPARVLRHIDAGHGTAVHLFALGNSRTVFDLRKRLADAVVQREEPDGTWRTCPWSSDRHGCSSEWWQDVFAGDNEVGNSRRRCIFLQPHRDGGRLRMTWRAPPAARGIEGRFGNRLWAVRHGDVGSDLKLTVRVGDRVVHEQTLPPADFAWHAFHAPLQAADFGRDVTFEFRAEKHAWRQACFDARLVDPPRELAPAPGPAR